MNTHKHTWNCRETHTSTSHATEAFCRFDFVAFPWFCAFITAGLNVPLLETQPGVCTRWLILKIYVASVRFWLPAPSPPRILINIYIYRDESSISTIKKKSEAVSMTMNRKSFNNLWFRTSLQIYSCVSVLWCLSVPSFDSIRGETSWCVQAHVSISEVYTAEDTRCCRDVFRCSS